MAIRNKQDENNFFALLKDGDIRKITLSRKVTAEIKQIFTGAASDFKSSDLEEIEFDGNYRVDSDEILFVNFNITPITN